MTRWATVVGLGLVLVLILSGRDGSAAVSRQTGEATPGAGQACGKRARTWSEAAANGVRARLVRARLNESAAADDPANHRRVAVRLTIVNGSEADLPLGLAAFGLVDCSGAVYPAVADPERRALPDVMRAGREAVGWVTFVVPLSADPALFVVRVDDGASCRVSLGFPLRLPAENGTPAPADALLTATPAALDRFVSPCEGGSATGGADTVGEDAATDDGVADGDGAEGGDGADGADGADAVGGDAVGEDGCPGEDASGAGAVGGDGGDGGDASSAGDAADATATACHDGEGA